MLGLTCVSHVEEDGAGREAKVGDVCSELEPLQTRGENKTQRDFFVFCSSSAAAADKRCCKKKKKRDCFPADAQSADPLQQQPLVCGVNARERTRRSFCHFKLKPTLYVCGAGGPFAVYESVTVKSSSSPVSRKNNDDGAECLIKKHNNNNNSFFKVCL